MNNPQFSDLCGRLFDIDPDGDAVQFEGAWRSWGWVQNLASQVQQLLKESGIGYAAVSFLARNTPEALAALVGLVTQPRTIRMIYAFQSPAAIAASIEKLGSPGLLLMEKDLTPEVLAMVQRLGISCISLGENGARLAVPGRRREPAAPEPNPTIDILTSGTTGPPKRQDIKTSVLERTVFSVTSGEKAPPDAPPEFAYWQFGGIGVCQLVAGVHNARRIVMLERFTVDGFVNAIKTHRIKRSGVQPAVVRMLLDANVPKADLASLEFLISASGPLDPETRDEFEKHFDIPIRLAYGATEFAGSLCAWTRADIEEFGESKRNSVGRPLPDTRVRVVDPETGAELPTGEQGLLEAKVAPISPDWIRTTDIASIDADGFVTLHGRADGAINRGGFKILPETVRRVLISHPAVRDACVVGVPDKRLGQVPFAAIEPTPGMQVPSSDELKGLVRQALPVYNVPVDFVVVDELPRNPALKVSLPAVAALYEARANR